MTHTFSIEVLYGVQIGFVVLTVWFAISVAKVLNKKFRLMEERIEELERRR